MCEYVYVCVYADSKREKENEREKKSIWQMLMTGESR